MSMIKVRLGENLAARSDRRRRRAMSLKVIAHNVLILLCREVFYGAGCSKYRGLGRGPDQLRPRLLSRCVPWPPSTPLLVPVANSPPRISALASNRGAQEPRWMFSLRGEPIDRQPTAHPDTPHAPETQLPTAPKRLCCWHFSKGPTLRQGAA